jgi:hypothetical protein
MLGEYTVGDTDDVGRDPAARPSMARKATVDDDMFLVSEDDAAFVSQGWRHTFDQIKKALTSRRDVSTVLDIVGRPKSLGGLLVPLVEKCVESFENKCLVRFVNCLRHFKVLLVQAGA